MCESFFATLECELLARASSHPVESAGIPKSTVI